MSDIPLITFEQMDKHLAWDTLADAIAAGHSHARPILNDTFLRRDDETLLNRSAWISGLGIAVKVASVFPSQTPPIDGGVMIFDDSTGVLSAVLDFKLVTKWKTVADSMLGARLLARPDSKNILIIGAGTVAQNLIDAYRSCFKSSTITLWNRNFDRADAVAKRHGVTACKDLPEAVANADIISCATMSTDPVLKGAWLRAGQHIDLIGAYRADMRETDDDALTRARVFVDSRDTTMDHIGELKIPLENGVIEHTDIIADFYDIPSGRYQRETADEITLFKNGGGAHLDLMVATEILKIWRQLQS